MFCENCGNFLPEDAKFCHNCGAKVSVAGTESQTAQEAAASADTVQVDAAPAADTVIQTEQQAVPAEPTGYEPQPEPVAPAAQPSPAYPAPQPEPVRYAPPQPAPQAPTYQQPAQAQTQAYQQPAVPKSQSAPAIAKSERPLPVWKFMGIMLLTGIPIIGFIMILVWSFGNSCNKNTKNFARAVLIFGIIGFILTIVGVIINLEAIRAFIEYFNSNFEIGLTG